MRCLFARDREMSAEFSALDISNPKIACFKSVLLSKLQQYNLHFFEI
jgi:hypothetical protein